MVTWSPVIEITDLMIRNFDVLTSFITGVNQKEMACKELEGGVWGKEVLSPVVLLSPA